MARAARCFLCLCEAGSGVELQAGHGAEICRDCVLRLASLAGWQPPPPEPFGRRTLDDIEGELRSLDLPMMEVAGLELAYRARLTVSGPFREHELREASKRIAQALGRGHDPRSAVDVVALPPRERCPVAIETGAGVLYFPVVPPVPGAGAQAMHLSSLLGHLDEYRNYWRLLEPGPDHYYGKAVEALVLGDPAASLEALDHVDPEHPTGEAGRLLRALVRILRGRPRDWSEAQAALTALLRECGPSLKPLVRFDLARLLLARGHTAPAAALLDECTGLEAARLRRPMTPAFLGLGECRTRLRQIAGALGEFRAQHGHLPRTLADLQGGLLQALPTCPVTLGGYRYAPREDGTFSLRCPGVGAHRAAGAASGYPRWDPLVGPICHPADRPRRRGAPRALGWTPSGPLEAMAFRVRGMLPTGPRAALWLSSARESAGDLPGALTALEPPMAGSRPGLYFLHRTLLLIRLEEPREALEALGRCLDHTPFSATGSPLSLLYRRFEVAFATLQRMEARPYGLPLLTGMFVLLCRAGLPERAARLVPPEEWTGQGGERLRYLVHAIRLLGDRRGGRARLRKELSGGGNPIRQALEFLYDGRLLQAILCLEIAASTIRPLESELRLLLARAWREAGLPAGALRSLEFQPAAARGEWLRHRLEELLAGLAAAGPDAPEDLVARTREGVEEVVRAGLAEAPRPSAYPEMAEALLRVGSPDPGLLERMLAQEPLGPREEIARAALLQAAGRGDEARDALQRLVTGWPGWPAASLLLAGALLGEARAEEAVPILQAALAAHPGHVRTRALLMRALEAAGRPEQVEEHRRELGELRPDLRDPAAAAEGPAPLDGPAPADLLPSQMAALAEEWYLA